MSRANREFKEERMKEELEVSQGRAFGMEEAAEDLSENAQPEQETVASEELEPGNLTEEDLKNYEDSLTPAENDSSNYPEVKVEEPESAPIEQEAVVSPIQEAEHLQEETLASPLQENELLKNENLTAKELSNARETAREIKQTIEVAKEEKQQREKTSLEKKNELIKEHKDIILDYMKIREKAIQLQEQIKEDNKVFAKFKKFITGAPKTGLMEAYREAYDSIKKKEKEIEEKTGATPNDMIRLWEQYKQSKERQRSMQEKTEE
jgi:hypothetical protein